MREGHVAGHRHRRNGPQLLGDAVDKHFAESVATGPVTLMSRLRKQDGFTLVELLVASAVSLIILSATWRSSSR